MPLSSTCFLFSSSFFPYSSTSNRKSKWVRTAFSVGGISGRRPPSAALAIHQLSSSLDCATPCYCADYIEQLGRPSSSSSYTAARAIIIIYISTVVAETTNWTWIKWHRCRLHFIAATDVGLVAVVVQQGPGAIRIGWGYREGEEKGGGGGRAQLRLCVQPYHSPENSIIEVFDATRVCRPVPADCTFVGLSLCRVPRFFTDLNRK